MMTVDFRKAYNMATCECLAAVLNLMQLPPPYIRLILHIMASPRLSVVGGDMITEVVRCAGAGA